MFQFVNFQLGINAHVFHHSGTGELIVTSQYEEIRIWQLKLKKEIRRQVVKNMTCNAIDLTRDGKTIISGEGTNKPNSTIDQFYSILKVIII